MQKKKEKEESQERKKKEKREREEREKKVKEERQKRLEDAERKKRAEAAEQARNEKEKEGRTKKKKEERRTSISKISPSEAVPNHQKKAVSRKRRKIVEASTVREKPVEEGSSPVPDPNGSSKRGRTKKQIVSM